jgi:hypothetical protein
MLLVSGRLEVSTRACSSPVGPLPSSSVDEQLSQVLAVLTERCPRLTGHHNPPFLRWPAVARARPLCVRCSEQKSLACHQNELK